MLIRCIFSSFPCLALLTIYLGYRDQPIMLIFSPIIGPIMLCSSAQNFHLLCSISVCSCMLIVLFRCIFSSFPCLALLTIYLGYRDQPRILCLFFYLYFVYYAMLQCSKFSPIMLNISMLMHVHVKD